MGLALAVLESPNFLVRRMSPHGSALQGWWCLRYTFNPSLGSCRGLGNHCLFLFLKRSQTQTIICSTLSHMGRLEMQLTWVSWFPMIQRNIHCSKHYICTYEHIIVHPNRCMCGSSLYIYSVFIVTSICRECEQGLFSW